MSTALELFVPVRELTEVADCKIEFVLKVYYYPYQDKLFRMQCKRPVARLPQVRPETRDSPVLNSSFIEKNFAEEYRSAQFPPLQ